MNSVLLVILSAATAQITDGGRDGKTSAAEPIETRFQQVAPRPREGMERTPGRARAVLLLHGLGIHPINNAKVYEPLFHDWQQPGSVLVKALARDFDVFAFAYSQNSRVEAVAET